MDKDEWVIQLGADLWDDEFRVRLEHQLWVLSQELLAQGQSVILEWGHWARIERDEKRLGARALGVESNCTISMRPWRSSSSERNVAMRRANGQPRL